MDRLRILFLFSSTSVEVQTIGTKGVAKKQEENNNLPGLDLPEHKLIFARAFTHVPNLSSPFFRWTALVVFVVNYLSLVFCAVH